MALDAKPTESQMAEIEGMLEPFGSAIVAAEWDTWLTNYTEDTVVMPPNAPPLHGKAALREWAEALPPVTEFIGKLDEVLCYGDVAVVRGSYEMSMAIPDLPEPMRDVGSFLEVRERQPDGRWLLARDIFNSDLPLPE